MSAAFDDLVRLLAKLRSVEGCPWDREQTHESLKPNLLEESYEVLEAIDHSDPRRLSEELGDVLLQVLFHAELEAEAGRFAIEDVMQQLGEKLVRRHPHVFGAMNVDEKPRTATEVLARWETIKQNERNEKGKATSILDGVTATLPALMRALQVQERAARVGFDWPSIDGALDKVEEECRELRAARAAAAPSDRSRHQRVEEEFGDLLFTLVNLARFLQVNPEDTLRRATARFSARFRYIETQARGCGKELRDLSLEQMDRWWNEAKEIERRNPSEPNPH